MKKSKIIIPALGVLVLSTAASITGTVAWFTANRAATVTVGDMAVVKTDGALAKIVEAGAGTTTTGSQEINAVSGAKITDVSFNPATKQLYGKANGNATAFRTIGDTDDYLTTTDSGHPYKINASNYYAFTWKVTLRYTWGADETPVNVFFDIAGSSMTKSKQEGAGEAADNATAKGFRIAMIASRTIVYAGLESAAELKSVISSSADDEYGDTGLTNVNFSYFASDKYAKGDTTAGSATTNPSPISNFAKALDGESGQTSRADYLGQITHSGATDDLVIYCVAWYEGTDQYVVDGKELQKVQSTLAFYAAIN